MKATLPFFLLIPLVLVMVGCKKDAVIPDNSFHAGFAAAETGLEDALNISRTFLSTKKLPFSTLNCPASIDTLVDGLIEIRFSDSCKSGDSRFRSGRLLIHPSDGFERRVDLMNYSIFTDSSYAILGSMYYSVDQSLNPFFKINVRCNFHLFDLRQQKEMFVANVQHQRETIEGVGTADTKDDIISKSGSGTFTLPDDSQWSMNYSSSATKRLTIGCIDFVTGQAVFANNKGNSFLFDWGGGTCDNRYTVTISEKTSIHNIP